MARTLTACLIGAFLGGGVNATDIFSQEDELGAIGDYKDTHYQYDVIVTKRNGYKRNMDAVPGLIGKSTYLNLRLKVEEHTNSTGATQSRLHAISGISKMIPADATQTETPKRGDFLIGVDGIDFAAGTLQDAIENFMETDGQEPATGALMFPLVQPQTELTEENRWFCYQDRYPDLQKQIPTYNVKQLEQHWNMHGELNQRDARCAPDTPFDEHGFAVRGFMKVEFMSVAQPERFKFQAVGEHREAMTLILDEQRSAENVELRRRRKLKEAEEKRIADAKAAKEAEVRRQQEAAEAERQELMRIEQERKDEIARQAAEVEREKAEKIRREAEEQRQREEFNRKRAAGEEFMITAVFKYEGPMGLTFKVDPSGTSKRTLVNEVKPDSPAFKLGIRSGDHLTGVNEVDVSKSKPKQAINAIGAADWPRVLRFTVEATKEAVKERGAETVVRIVAPLALEGDYVVEEAPWSCGDGNCEEKQREDGVSCTTFKIEEANPLDGCGKELGWKSMEDGEKTILMVHRGTCQFLQKAKSIAKAGGVGALVVNTDDTTISMPSGNQRTHDIRFPVAMIDQSNGLRLIRVSTGWEQKVTGWIGKADQCEDVPNLGQLHHVAASRSSSDYDGKLVVQTVKGESIHEWKAAEFGPRFGQKYPEETGDVFMPEGMLKFLAVSEPLASCAVGDLQARVKGMIAVVERGECGFLDKVVAVQKAGAVAVVIMNTQEGVIPMMADPAQVEEQEAEVGGKLIPMIMVGNRLRDVLREIRRWPEEPLYGRIIVGKYD